MSARGRLVVACTGVVWVCLLLVVVVSLAAGRVHSWWSLGLLALAAATSTWSGGLLVRRERSRGRP